MAPATDDDGVRQPLLEDQSRATTGSRAADGEARGGERGATEPAQGSFKRNLGTIEAFAIIISIVIGSGIFTSPGAIDTNVPSVAAALLTWVVGGVLAWTGASTMAELGTAIPGEGGVQPYLQYIFGDVFGFLAAWTWVVAVMPATLAILSIVFVESIYSAVGYSDGAGSFVHKILSILILVAVSVANSISTTASTRLNNLFVVTKFVTIFLVVLAGMVVVIIQVSDPEKTVGGRDWYTHSWFEFRKTITPEGDEIDWNDLSQWELLGHYSTALYGSLWAYSGWDKAIYISAELSAPARQLPLSINTAIPTIILCFITANIAYYILLPWSVLSTTDSVAVTAMARLLGPAFGIVAAVLICLVVAGSLLGNSFVAGRMAVSASRRGWLPELFAVVGKPTFRSTSIGSDATSSEIDESSTQSDAPVNAIVLSVALSALYILFGNFRALLTFNGLGEYTFFFLTVLGAIILRFREPGLPRPYKPVLLIPSVFAAVSGFVVVRGAAFAPFQALILVAVWAVGLLFYYFRRKLAGSRVE